MWLFHSYCTSKARLVGKTVVITGANSGIGREAARDFYRRGARVILACRDVQKAEQAVEDLKKNPPSCKGEQYEGEPGELQIYRLNLSSLKSVKECARNILSAEPALHILVNNAGVMMCPYEKTEDGYESQFQVNYLGHFLLTLLLLPKLEQSAPGCRIVNVSSLAHMYGDIPFDNLNAEKSYSPTKNYAQSKLANILFTKELAIRLQESNITGINVYSLHPGMVRTELLRHVDKTLFSGARTLFRFLTPIFVKNSEQGAQTILHCVLDEKAGKETGLYYRECKSEEPWAKGKDLELAHKLWDFSCETLGIQPQKDLKKLVKDVAQKMSVGSE